MYFCEGIDLEKYIYRYIREHLEELKEQAIEDEEFFIQCNYESLVENEEIDDCYKRIEQIKNIKTVRDFEMNIGFLIDKDIEDEIEEIVFKELQEKYYKCISLVVEKVESMIKDNMEIIKNYSHSICPGDFRSFYITIQKEEDEDYNIYQKTIRVCDGHDNGRNNADLEINFENLLNNNNYYDIELQDLIDDLEDL